MRAAILFLAVLLLAACGSKPKLDDRAACHEWSTIRPGASGANPAKFPDRVDSLAGRATGDQLTYLLNRVYIEAETGSSRSALQAMTKVDAYCARR